MTKILLACAMGMSTSLLVSKMKEAANDLDGEYKIWAIDIDSIDDEDDYDIVLLGPQVSYKLKEVIEDVDNKDIPIHVIDKMDYGTCNGEAVLKFAIDALNNK